MQKIKIDNFPLNVVLILKLSYADLLIIEDRILNSTVGCLVTAINLLFVF